MGEKMRLTNEELTSIAIDNAPWRIRGDVHRLLDHIAALEADARCCCPRDHNADGDCDRHPIGTVARLERHISDVEAEKTRLGRANEELATQVVDLQDHISDLEKSLENARKERDEALARIKPSGQVAEDVADVVRWINGPGSSPCKPEKCPCLGHRALFHLAAQAQGYEAAVADNAEMLRLIVRDANGGKNGACVECGNIGHHDRDCALGMVSRADHPGAALLEELREAATLLHQRPGETLPEAIRRAYADHDKALVRARNEGVERSANALEEIDGGYFGLAEKMRAMKEPEQ